MGPLQIVPPLTAARRGVQDADVSPATRRLLGIGVVVAVGVGLMLIAPGFRKLWALGAALATVGAWAACEALPRR